MKLVSATLFHVLNHRQYKQFSLQINNDYDDLFYNKVRRLSKGNTLKRFALLLPKIKAFLY